MASKLTTLVHNHRCFPRSHLNRLYILHLHLQAAPLHRTDIAPTTPKSPSGLWPPQTTSPVSCGYTIRPCEIPPVDTRKPDPEFHDTRKVNGLDFPATVRSSKFTHYKDIESMDPLQVPLWKFLRQGLHNKWLRRIAHGRETYVIPFDNNGTTVFVAELVSQLRSRNIDLDRLAAYRSRNQGTNLNRRKPLSRWRGT